MNRRLKQDITKIERFFKKRYDISFEKDIIDKGYCKENLIVIRSDMSHEEKLKTIIHEFIHLAWKVDHGRLSRKIGYNSISKDYLSDVIYGVIFPRRKISRNGYRNGCANHR